MTLGNIKIVFGGFKNLIKKSLGKITSEEWDNLRNPYIYCIGSKSDDMGNRKVKIDLENNKVIFCPDRKNKFNINLENISKAQLLVLNK